jgi:hypothetical protein
MRHAGRCARRQAIPEQGVLGLVVQVQGEEVQVRVCSDDRGAVAVAGLDLADEARQFAVKPAEDAVHEDQAGGVATGGLAPRQ